VKIPKQKLIVFDLDETLIHATQQPLAIAADLHWEDYHIYKRPGLDAFLTACSQLAEIALWSSAADDYVAGIAGQLLPLGIKPAFIWGQSECWVKIVQQPLDAAHPTITRKVQQWIKPLEKIRRKGYKMQNLLIIDDSHTKVIDNPGNYLLVAPFEGDPADTEFQPLLAYLQTRAFTPAASQNWK
jgi:carboxy-terminal domain RNA polymerase II polypeptide A small phosphatase